jgi:hypothetical protein
MNHANDEELDEIKMALEAAQTMADRFQVPIAVLNDLQIRACNPENHSQTIEVVRPKFIPALGNRPSQREGRYADRVTHVDTTNQKGMEGINNLVITTRTRSYPAPDMKRRRIG